MSKLIQVHSWPLEHYSRFPFANERTRSCITCLISFTCLKIVGVRIIIVGRNFAKVNWFFSWLNPLAQTNSHFAFSRAWQTSWRCKAAHSSKQIKQSSDRLIAHIKIEFPAYFCPDLTLYPYTGFLEQTRHTDLSQKISLRILPSIPLRTLRMKICKILKQDARRTQVRCWLRIRDGSLSELVKQDDSKDLDWLGIENGSQIIYEVIQWHIDCGYRTR